MACTHRAGETCADMASVRRKSRMKFCLFRNCSSKSKDNPDTAFFSFPRPCMKVRRKQVVASSDHVKICSACEKCTKWISLCRINSLYYTEQLIPLKKAKDLDICSLHFVNGHPYSTKFPDPLPSKTVLDIKNTIHKRKAPPEAAEGSSTQPEAKKINSELIEHIEIDDLSLKVEDDSHIEILNDRLMNSVELPEDNVPVSIKQEGIEDPLEIYPPELSPLEFHVEEENPFADGKCDGLIDELGEDYPLKFSIKAEIQPSALPSVNNSDIATLTPNKFECDPALHKETQTIPIQSRLLELERENELLKLEVARLRRVLKARAKQCSVCESMLC